MNLVRKVGKGANCNESSSARCELASCVDEFADTKRALKFD